MVTTDFLKENRKFINMTALGKILENAGVMKQSTLVGKMAENRPLKVKESLQVKDILEKAGIKKRKRITGEEIKKSDIIKTHGFLGVHPKITKWTTEKIYKDKGLDPEEEKAFAEIISTIAEGY